MHKGKAVGTKGLPSSSEKLGRKEQACKGQRYPIPQGAGAGETKLAVVQKTLISQGDEAGGSRLVGAKVTPSSSRLIRKLEAGWQGQRVSPVAQGNSGRREQAGKGQVNPNSLA